jgi:hypothetical protein
VRTASILRLAGSAVVGSLLIAGCGSNDSDDDGGEQWRPALERAASQGLKVRWLGKPPVQDDDIRMSTLEGPLDLQDVSGDALTLHYFDISNANRIDITTFSPEQWDRERDRILVRPDVPPTEVKAVHVDGVSGTLISTALGSRPVNSLEVILEFDDCVVYATTNSSVAEGGQEMNALIHEDKFVAILEKLRRFND